MEYQFITADVFTDKPFDGVPISVFPKAEGLSKDQMQMLANELNSSETVFVIPAEDGKESHTLKIFNPQEEVGFGGHTTVATVHVLAETGLINTSNQHTPVTLNGKDGTLSAHFSKANGSPSLTQYTQSVKPIIDRYVPTNADLAPILGLAEGDIGFDNYKCMIVSCGKPYLIVPIKSYRTIRLAKFEAKLWSESSLPSSFAQDILLFSNNTDPNAADFHARLLGPTIGPFDDPPIGAAVPAFSGYLCDHPHIQQGTHVFAVQRGANEARQSLLHIEMDNKQQKELTIRVGGSAVIMSKATINV